MVSKRTIKKLFEPGKIGSMELKNRIVMPGMGTRLEGLWGEVTDDLIKYFSARARGGAGLIITGAAFAATAVDPMKVRVLHPRLDDDSYCPGLAKMAEAIHDAGAKMCIQLSAGTGAEGGGGAFTPDGLQHIEELPLVGPSDVPSPAIQKEYGVARPVRPLTIEEIGRIVELCGWAAERVKRTGHDAIELHAHDGFLEAQFMSPYFNKRQDRYGGSLENRLRFIMEIIASVRKHVGPSFPVILRYSVDEVVKGGWDLKEGLEMARRFEKAGINALNVSVGIHGCKRPTVASMYWPEGYMVPLAEALKAAVSIPVIVSGRLGDPLLAEQVLREGKADFIGMGRPLITDPELPLKAAAGRLNEIRRCIACNECSRVMRQRYSSIRCTLNAVAGRERNWENLVPAVRAKKVVVVGGGPGGMEAARVAGLRGHKVKLYEKANELEGLLKLAAKPPHKEGLSHITEYYNTVLGQTSNVTLVLGKEATPANILKDKPDAVIVATGGRPIIPDVPGIKRASVVTALDVLSGKVRVGKVVAVIGGGMVGCETAHLLADQSKKVTIVEMLPKAGADIDGRTRDALMDKLVEKEVKILTNTTLAAVTDAGITVADREGKKTVLKADTVVLALGLRPINALAGELRGKVKEVYTIGDAKEAGRILDAVSGAYTLAFGL